MSWYNPASWSFGDAAKGFVLGGPIGAVANASTGGKIWNSTLGNDPGADAERQRKELLYQQAKSAGTFADQAQGSYQALGNEAAIQRAYLGRLAMGQDSLSAEQLRQGVQQNQAAQISMAAGASPQNAAGAARTAAIQSARIGSGMAGAAAFAGIQERQGAQGQLSQLILNQRGQDMQTALGSRQTATQGYGAGNAGAPEKSWIEKYGPALEAAGSAAAKSDVRAKTDLKDGDNAANAALEGLKAYVFRYKNPSDGAGPQLGTTAQDLEKVGLGQAVIDTPDGKVVHGAKLAGANTALIAALGRRVSELEDGRSGKQLLREAGYGRPDIALGASPRDGSFGRPTRTPTTRLALRAGPAAIPRDVSSGRPTGQRGE